MQHHHHTTTRAALSALILALAATFGPAPASAAPACPGNARPTPAGACIRRIDRRTVCAWPATVNGRRVAVCVRSR